MVLVILFLGVVLLVAGIRGTYHDLFAALGTDVPGYIVWGAAILAVGAIGLIPGLKPISKGLLGLILVVLIVNNYQKVIAGFHSAVSAGEAKGAAPATPSTTAAPAAASSSSSGGINVGDILSLASLAGG